MRLNIMLTSLVIALTASTAIAAPKASPVTVKFASSLAQSNHAVIVLNKAWNCVGDTCVGTLERRNPAVRDCRQFKRAVGSVVAFSVGTKSLNAADIAACNAPAR